MSATTYPTRTDVHRPSALVTEDYEYVLSYDAHPHDGDRRELGAYIRRTGRTFGENHSAGVCFVCGAHARYIAVFRHVPTDKLVKVGETCADRLDYPSGTFHALRKRAELDRKAQKVKRARLAWFAVDEDRELAFLWASERVREGAYGWEGMRHTFVSKVNRYGSTSDKFVRAIMRDMVRTERREEERAAREAAEAATASPVVEGRITVEGEVLTTKWQESSYGYGSEVLKMLVRDARGFKVWGTVPAAIDNVERGERVRFTATVEASQDDPTFGFFKRPSKAEVVA